MKRTSRSLKMWKVSVMVVCCITLVSASCPEDCRCPSEVPRCPEGVGLIQDSCGCCRVCARQLFEDCSRSRPCDPTKGLECNFGGGYGSTKGVCRAKSDGRTCEYDGSVYQNGESFRPDCRHRCICMDGAVGCASVCPVELALPKPGCTGARWVEVPGGCCQQLVCPGEANGGGSVVQKQREGLGKERSSENDPTNKKASVWKGGSRPSAVWSGHPVVRTVPGGVQCVPRVTAWSPCSHSCGFGLSTRMTNDNAQCKLLKETRVCGVRSCSRMPSKRDQKCNHPGKPSSHPTHPASAGCRSLKRSRSRSCGRCCRAHRTRAPPVHLQHRSAESVSRRVEVTESCECDCLSDAKNTATFSNSPKTNNVKRKLVKGVKRTNKLRVTDN